MDVVFGTSSKGKRPVIYRNFDYIKERENRCGTTSWRCTAGLLTILFESIGNTNSNTL